MHNIKCKNCANLKNDWCDKKNDSPDPELLRDCGYYLQMSNADHMRSMTITNCPKCGGSVRAETIGWFCNECRGFIDMHGRYYPYKNKSFLPPQTNADHIRGMTDNEMARELIPLFEEIFEDGIPSPEWFNHWLQQPYRRKNEENVR